MRSSRAVHLIGFVTWFNVKMLLASEFFILLTFISPLIFATLAFFLFKSGGGSAGASPSPIPGGRAAYPNRPPAAPPRSRGLSPR